ARMYPPREIVSLCIGQCNTTFRPVEVFMDFRISRANAVDTNVASQRRIRRGLPTLLMSQINGLPIGRADAVRLQGIGSLLHVGVIQAKENVEWAVDLDSANTVGSQWCFLITQDFS